MTAQQSAAEVKAFRSAYPHGTSAAPSSAAPSDMSGGGAVTPAAGDAASTADRKRKHAPTSPADANGSAEGDDDKKPQASKKSRRELPPHTVAILKGWMLSREHVKHPYPTDEDKQMLLKKTGISMKQLTNWFTNARKRIWKPMMRREHSRQLQSALEYDKAAVRPPREFPGAGLGQYGDNAGSYGPRPVVRHSFDAGSLGGPPPHAPMDRYAPPPPHAGTPAFPMGAPLYPPRGVRSMSEAPARTDMDDYLDAERIRARVFERGHDDQPNQKRYRNAANSLSPRGLKVLQDWVSANAHREYPYPTDPERVQLARETGMDVSQVDGWVTSLRDQMSGTTSSTPSAGNPQFPPPPAYGERRSIPSTGNSMFPPRPTAPGSLRPSIPSAGNPQFPPPPAVRREGSGGAEGYYPRYGAGGSQYPGYDPARPTRSLTISASQYLHPPAPRVVSAGGDPQALPSLSSRNLLSQPPPPQTATGPTMGQPRDGRSRTLDMGQFADARRRKMNFQDILASTGGAVGSAAPVATSVAMLPTSGRNNAENMYPNGAPASAGYAPPASSDYQQQKLCGRCGAPAGACGCGLTRPPTSGEQLSGGVSLV
ncbi:hypothetical protein BBJ28_00012091 [Nothophytophthora sp. Chile5]|nr:hypothetical protein BBJ28_00012091 [Nothophytophthora sp. Chile5]